MNRIEPNRAVRGFRGMAAALAVTAALFAGDALALPLSSGELIYKDCSKAQTISGAFMINNEFMGGVDVKFGKKSGGKAKVSVNVTFVRDGKKETAKTSGTIKFDLCGGGEAKSLGFRPKSFAADILTLTVNYDGTFLLSGNTYSMMAAKMGGALRIAKLEFNCYEILNDPPKVDAGYTLLADALPSLLPFTVSGGKTFVFPKGKKLKIGKQKVPGTNQYVYGVEGNDDTNPNRSMLKLSYKDKTGFFSGNFKYYATQKIPSKNGEKLKLKTYSAKICGFMTTDTPSNPIGVGYGAPAKNPDFQTWKVYLLTPGTAIIVNP